MKLNKSQKGQITIEFLIIITIFFLIVLGLSTGIINELNQIDETKTKMIELQEEKKCEKIINAIYENQIEIKTKLNCQIEKEWETEKILSPKTTTNNGKIKVEIGKHYR